MLTLTVLAVGLTAAAWFSSRVGGGLPNRRHQLAPAAADETARADDRGITLQTLIVTAVLVLMAVAAGVVIVAITNSSSDDLEESGTDVQARCNSVEIYDPVVASRNELGVHKGSKIEGSAIGCIPVCTLTHDPLDAMLTANELGFSRGSLSFVPETRTVAEIRPLLPQDLGMALASAASFGLIPMNRLELPFLVADGNVENGAVVVHVALPDEPTLIQLARGEYDPTIPDSGLTTFPMPVDPRIDRIAIAPNQNQCIAYDSSGNPILP